MSVEYPMYDKLTRHLLSRGVRVINTEYNDKITLEAVIPSDEYKNFVSLTIDAFSGKLSVDNIDDIIEKI